MGHIDAETGRWLKNKSWIAIVIFVAYAAYLVSGYAKEVDRSRAHVDAFPARIAHYNKIIAEQQVFNALIKDDMGDALKHRDRLEKAISNINTHLERLQLVAEVATEE